MANQSYVYLITIYSIQIRIKFKFDADNSVSRISNKFTVFQLNSAAVATAAPAFPL